MTDSFLDAVGLGCYVGSWTLSGLDSSVTFRSSAMWDSVKVRGRFARLAGEGHIPDGWTSSMSSTEVRSPELPSNTSGGEPRAFAYLSWQSPVQVMSQTSVPIMMGSPSADTPLECAKRGGEHGEPAR
jgi:hypothetical protein